MSTLVKVGTPRYIPATAGMPGRSYSRVCPLPMCYGGGNDQPNVNCTPPQAPIGRNPPPGLNGSGGTPAPVCRYIPVYNSRGRVIFNILVCT